MGGEWCGFAPGGAGNMFGLKIYVDYDAKICRGARGDPCVGRGWCGLGPGGAGTRVGNDEEIKKVSVYDRCCDCGAEEGDCPFFPHTESPSGAKNDDTCTQRSDLFVNQF